jgi:2,3-bisphosphoglycerate-independent phosphoglycerate mutase
MLNNSCLIRTNVMPYNLYMNRRAILLIMDGYGLGEPGEGNAIFLAGAGNVTRLMKHYPSTTLRADGLAVGLPEGQMGNSEVGHLNLGAGKVVYHKLTVINQAVVNGEFFLNETLLMSVDRARGHKLHIAGLCSDGGVHSNPEHLFEILRVAKENCLKDVYIHVFLDGRDASPTSGLGFVRMIEQKMAEIGIGKIATVCGRYSAMDRDNRWDRTEKAYNMMVCGKARHFDTAEEAITHAYKNGETDEFVLPTVIDDNGLIEDKDSFVHINFRPDRARQLSKALTADEFKHFNREKKPDIFYACMTEYDQSLDLPIIFTEQMLAQDIIDTLGSAVSEAGLTQLRIAETEKYAHVTYFLNGGREDKYEGEVRIMVPSPSVATYDLQPKMSAPEVEEKMIEAINSQKFNLIVCNLANCDMVGHTGVIPAAIKAVRQIDESVGQITETAQKNGYYTIIIADHGNAEKMLDENGQPFTAHTTNPVPCILVPPKGDKSWELAEGGVLADVTGLILYLLGIEAPPKMKKSVLLPRK